MKCVIPIHIHLADVLVEDFQYCIYLVYNCVHFLVPGSPKLRLLSATTNTVFFSWTVPNGSVVDYNEIKWEVERDHTATFRDTALPTSFNSYTVTGLQDYGNAIVSISVTAHNAMGSSNSTSMHVAANLVTENSGTHVTVAASVGTVIAGLLISISVIVAVLMCYRYKLKSRRNM